MNPSSEIDEEAAFSLFETAAAVMAFIWRKFGESGLRELLTLLDQLDREFLQEAADELKEVGLIKAGAIVAKAAALAPPKRQRLRQNSPR